MTNQKPGTADTAPIGRRACQTPICLLAAVAVFSLLAWLVLRQPALRAQLMSMANHRLITSPVRMRELLAPRSVFLAGCSMAVLVALFSIGNGFRRALFTPIPKTHRAVFLFALLQALVAMAVIINLQAYFLRQYGRPAGLVDADAVMTQTLPQAWPDSKRLASVTDAGARVAFRTDTPDIFFLPALSYPRAFFEILPVDENALNSDAQFLRFRAEKGLTHYLRHEPFDRAHPLILRSLAPGSGELPASNPPVADNPR
ncbi:MAG: hypothetical protein NTY46_03390 [Candidatus Sumerlaeota bacterium]|nr:hypothetical protein [Candidatus Sumerlaeota bacterium]